MDDEIGLNHHNVKVKMYWKGIGLSKKINFIIFFLKFIAGISCKGIYDVVIKSLKVWQLLLELVKHSNVAATIRKCKKNI
jgi:hypothetical protein